MVPGTSSHHPGHRCIAVRARARRWDVWLLGAPCQWREAAGEGYAPPREIGHHQPPGRPLGQGPAAVEEIPPFATMGASDSPHGPLRIPHQPAEGEREAGGEGDDGGAVVVEVHGGSRGPNCLADCQQGLDCPVARRYNVRSPERKSWGPPPRLAAPSSVRARGGGVAVSPGPRR